jgi:hypothetical protein
MKIKIHPQGDFKLPKSSVMFRYLCILLVNNVSKNGRVLTVANLNSTILYTIYRKNSNWVGVWKPKRK